MVTTKSKRPSGKCSQCGKVFRANTRTEVLNLIRKHMWKLHEAWMKRRIKLGLKKRRTTLPNPILAKALLSGVFPAATIPDLVTQYKGMSAAERNAVKSMLRALTVPIGGEASAIAEVTMRLLDQYTS